MALLDMHLFCFSRLATYRARTTLEWGLKGEYITVNQPEKRGRGNPGACSPGKKFDFNFSEKPGNALKSNAFTVGDIRSSVSILFTFTIIDGNLLQCR